MERKITRKDIPYDVIWLPNEIELPFERLWGSNNGKYGWNYSLYNFGYVTVGKGYRYPKNIGYDGRTFINILPSPDMYIDYQQYLCALDIVIKSIYTILTT